MPNDIVIYETPSKEVIIEVRLENDTVWLTQKQIAYLFDKDVNTIGEHIGNIFKDEELERTATTRKFRIVQKEGNREVERNIDCFNLDVIIAVGYRVNSLRGTQFRIWATNTLKEYLVKGYALNEKRLNEINDRYKELQNVITFMEQKSKQELLAGKEGEILHLLSNYAKTLTLLEEFDKGKVQGIEGSKASYVLTYINTVKIISELKRELTNKNEAGDLFGNERDKNFEGIINNIYQTFDGTELYPSLEDKAVSLLYLIIKDHPFSDGNKRIASFLFIYFLDKTNALYRKNGEKRINDNALVALALLIAESDPSEKEILINIVKNLISN
jgi:prophage maintenance system killer protein